MFDCSDVLFSAERSRVNASYVFWSVARRSRCHRVSLASYVFLALTRKALSTSLVVFNSFYLPIKTHLLELCV